ncbi:hypothetical protein AVEN_260261-1 [Araneus ventricosus]|uniref:Uncharacterized protein n=1 Tax=Araneus ventricosus TaxID=182803 RepID=A0A4Y2FR31_ARAVE|nr:hypothetical protein AVEN_260261-1 [Araneus ventricosus]
MVPTWFHDHTSGTACFCLSNSRTMNLLQKSFESEERVYFNGSEIRFRNRTNATNGQFRGKASYISEDNAKKVKISLSNKARHNLPLSAKNVQPPKHLLWFSTYHSFWPSFFYGEGNLVQERFSPSVAPFLIGCRFLPLQSSRFSNHSMR